MRFDAALAVALLALPLAAGAGPAPAIISPGNITLSDTHLNLVGVWSWASDPWNAADTLAYGARLTVTVRDIANNPVAGVPVMIDFSGCPGLRISGTQSYHGEISGCAMPWVLNYTGLQGRVSLVVVGSLQRRVDQAQGCARVYADNYYVGAISVGVYDQNDAGGMSLADIGLFWSDLGSGTYHARSDLDGNGELTLADVAYAWNADTNLPFNVSATTVCSNPPPPGGSGGGPPLVVPNPRRMP